ncbi:hypothetical protein [Amycolatopsis sp. YIM 10]|uniref:hypothetical protein n=1 Tax=Amycolatopsis sp. YIM 10 TaxID=2653857 RepID=UPI00128FDC9F|nr:hypothetical protein [Amycolatopsis sp. YIM 10]QFU86831.1 hypothetical protein YIM_08100 [Amycolatopsis sp. YIM 10]
MQPGGQPRYAPPKKTSTGLIIAIVAASVLVFAGIGVGAFFVFGRSETNAAPEKYAADKVPACASVAQRVPGLPAGRPMELPAGVTPKYGWSCSLTDIEDPRAVYLDFIVFAGSSRASGADGARKEFATFAESGGEHSTIGIGEEARWSAVTPIGAVRPGVQCELHIRDGNAVLGIGAFDAMGPGSSMEECRATVEAAAKPFFDAVQPA